MIRSAFGLTALGLLGLLLSACGGGEQSTTSTPHASAKQRTAASMPSSTAADARSSLPVSKPDADGDEDQAYTYHRNSRYDDDDNAILHYGRPANAPDQRLITSLVMRYRAAALAHNGALGCSLLYSIYAESMPEDYGQPPGPPSLRGTTCSVVLSKFFKLPQHEPDLIAGAATPTVMGVRVSENRGLVLLRVGKRFPRYIRVHRERGVWKVSELLDAGIG